MGGGRAWGCVKAMISADRAMLLLIGTVETLGCLPPHSNEKPWPPLVSKVTKAYCNCTFSNGVSHARTPTSVITITIMSLGSTGASKTSVTLGEGMFFSCSDIKSTTSFWTEILSQTENCLSPDVLLMWTYCILQQTWFHHHWGVFWAHNLDKYLFQ